MGTAIFIALYLTLVLIEQLAYWLPHALLIGLPVYGLARGRMRRPALPALVLSAAALLGSYSETEQCMTSARAYWSLRIGLDDRDDGSLVSAYTIEADMDDAMRRIPISRICPTWYDYTKEGVRYSASIRDGEVFVWREH